MNFNVKEIFITGHRPDKLGGYGLSPMQTWVKDSLKVAFDTIKPERVITGMALGVDQWAAEVCLTMGLPFVAAIPFKDQPDAWPLDSREHYHRLLAQACEIVIVTPGPYAIWKLQKRNEYMVDRGELGVAVWDGTTGGTANCVEYALKQSKPIVQIDPKEFNAPSNR
jgi:uncharacterized phage-like protein YoqJ